MLLGKHLHANPSCKRIDSRTLYVNELIHILFRIDIDNPYLLIQGLNKTNAGNTGITGAKLIPVLYHQLRRLWVFLY